LTQLIVIDTIISKYYHESHEYFIIFNILFMNFMNNLYMYLLCGLQKKFPDQEPPQNTSIYLWSNNHSWIITGKIWGGERGDTINWDPIMIVAMSHSDNIAGIIDSQWAIQWNYFLICFFVGVSNSHQCISYFFYRY